MYETMAGVPPFTGQNTLQTIYMHINEKAPKLSSITKNVPAQLESVIFKCLEKDPQDRYQSATEIQNILDALCADSAQNTTKVPHERGDAKRPGASVSRFQSAAGANNKDISEASSHRCL